MNDNAKSVLAALVFDLKERTPVKDRIESQSEAIACILNLSHDKYSSRLSVNDTKSILAELIRIHNTFQQ